MENYFLLAAICCFVPVSIWFVCLMVRKKVKKVQTFRTKENVKPEINKKIIFKEYRYDFLLPENGLLNSLRKVDVRDPQTRPQEENDVWFKAATPDLMHDGNCLAYIDHYGYLTDTFFQNIKELGLKPEEDLIFQELLISVYLADCINVYFSNYTNLFMKDLTVSST